MLHHPFRSLKSFVSRVMSTWEGNQTEKRKGKKTNKKNPTAVDITFKHDQVVSKGCYYNHVLEKILCLFAADESPAVNKIKIRILPA